MLFSRKDVNKHVEQLSLNNTVDIISQRFFDMVKSDPSPKHLISIQISKKKDPILFNSILIHKTDIAEKFKKEADWIGVIFKVTISYIDITLV